ncbi:tyrosine-type recombinase/integrase [Bradyrhizobium barranii]|uniref:Tyrosine-type recombinase/integrase n=1 Tax=Bradyrhizobium barranii TaxID=2992140 RepID=A0ABY3R0U3_9BRAD|nr:tyrosine-type recombinase/integrase [Bradyrhizobium japonicum]UFW90991.1 tyrosine-type recombinase/integrase [Bradyrhizobium japonicum]
MPRPKSGPRLWLDPAREKYSVIDGRKTVRTGCGKSELQAAKDFLRNYLAAHHTIKAGTDPLIADMLTVYADLQIAGKPSADSIARDLVNLEGWWGEKRASDINVDNCKEYIAHRNAPTICRREIGFLHAAAMFWHKTPKKGPLATMPVVFKPPAKRRTRWLTRSEAARFLWATRKLLPATRQRIRRFFIIGWYTGTRHKAISGVEYDSMIDLETRIMLRRPAGVEETNKRTPPVKMGSRLLSHLRRWRRLDGPDAKYPIQRGGRAARDMGEAWRKTRRLAELSKDVTPHTLRHSRATHMMRQRVDPWQASKALGMSVKMLVDVYGHHHPDWQNEAAEAR